MMTKFRIENCYLSGRNQEMVFDFRKGAKRIINLDGYAIVPLEDFAKHLENAAEAANIRAAKQGTPVIQP